MCPGHGAKVGAHRGERAGSDPAYAPQVFVIDERPAGAAGVDNSPCERLANLRNLGQLWPLCPINVDRVGGIPLSRALDFDKSTPDAAVAEPVASHRHKRRKRDRRGDGLVSPPHEPRSIWARMIHAKTILFWTDVWAARLRRATALLHVMMLTADEDYQRLACPEILRTATCG